MRTSVAPGRGGLEARLLCVVCSLSLVVAAPAVFAGERHVHYVSASGISNPDGASVFAKHCASCHGEDGRGSAQARAALGRQIPDLTRITDRHGEFDRLHVMSDIAQTGYSSNPGNEMPCWSRILRGMDPDPNTKLLIMRNLVRHLEGMQQVSSH